MSLTVLFTHLTIILLQYFQISIFRKIICIQTTFNSRLVDRYSSVFFASIPALTYQVFVQRPSRAK